MLDPEYTHKHTHTHNNQHKQKIKFTSKQCSTAQLTNKQRAG